MSDANDVVINTNANAVTLKKGTGDNTLLTFNPNESKAPVG